MEKNIATARKLQDSRGTAGGGDFGASFCSDSRATGASRYQHILREVFAHHSAIILTHYSNSYC